MKFSTVIACLTLIFGIVIAESNPEPEDAQREKRGYPLHPGGHYLSPHFTGAGLYYGSRLGPHLAAASIKGAAKTAALAAAKHLRAAQLSKAAHAAQAVAMDEASLAAKTSAALKAAQTTHSLIMSLVQELASLLTQAEAAATQAGKSVEAAHAVEATQRGMVSSAQNAAHALNKHQHLSISELKAAQAAAAHAHLAAKKAFTLSGY